tara:strand:+ start:1805 stop:2722 length:918 start_codon:yes stop_codon:yes gene_type:complete
MNLKKNLNILITGSTGLFGINFYNYSNQNNVYYLIHKKKLKLKNSVYINLNSNDKIYNFLKKKKINTVLHAASSTNIDKIEKNKKTSFTNIFTISKKLAEVCSRLNIKLVYISTDQLFDGSKKKYSENSKTNPLNYYGYLKKKTEECVIKLSKKNLIIRTNFFGFGTNYRKSFSDFILDNLKNSNYIKLVSDAYFSPVYVKTCIKLILKLIHSNAKGIYNISCDQKISKFDFGVKVSKKLKLNKKFILKSLLEDLNMVKRPKNMCLTNHKIKNKLNIKHIDINKEISKLKYDYFNLNYLKTKKLK